MVSYEMQNLTLQQIDIFFRCAEEMNFTKVARDLNITAGMVSKKIAAMETALGFALFRREKNRVALTQEGEALYAAWRPAVKSMLRQAEEIKGRKAPNDTIRFALWESTNLERFFVPLISSFSAEKDFLFQIRMYDNFDGLTDIALGKMDVAFIPKFAERGIRNMDELDYFLALPSPLYAAMSSDNPLSREKRLHIKELESCHLLVPENAISWYTDMLLELFENNRVSPKIKNISHEDFKTFYLSMKSDSIQITDKYFHAFSSNAVEYRELVGTESGLLMVYRKDAPPHVKQFVEAAKRFYRELR